MGVNELRGLPGRVGQERLLVRMRRLALCQIVLNRRRTCALVGMGLDLWPGMGSGPVGRGHEWDLSGKREGSWRFEGDGRGLGGASAVAGSRSPSE